MNIETKFKETEIGMIPEDWETNTISEITKKVVVGFVGTCYKFYCEKTKGIPMIRTTNLTDSGINYNELKYVVKDFHIKNIKSQLRKNDILVARFGKNGLACLFEEDFEANCLNVVVIRPDETKCIPRFLLYCFRSQSVRKQISASLVGTIMDILNTRTISKLVIPVPIISEQKSISKILSDLDFKIEFNQQMNKTLESMGRAIFKHWFIDSEFLNEEGKPYRSSGGQMMDSEIGLIPTGWKVVKIGSTLITKSGGTPSRNSDSYWQNGTIGWINSGKVRDFRIIEPVEFITEEAINDSSTKLIPKDTTVIAITGATLGEVSFMEIESCISQNVVAILGTENISSEFIYFWIKHIIANLMSLQTGGAQQHINKKIVDDSLLLIPDKQRMEKYNLIMKPIFEKISSNCFEVLNLIKIRDSLLPQLISGKIRVPVGVT